MNRHTETGESLEQCLSRHLNYFAAEIGPRPVGSPANQAAARYIARAFTAVGLNVAEQLIECPDWREQETVLSVAGRRFAAAANAFSPACDAVAPTVCASTLAELSAADLTGKIAVLTGDLTASPIWPKGWKLFSVERDWRIAGLLEEKRPAAVITVNPRPGRIDSVFEDWEFAIPSATVPAEAGLALLGHIGEPLSLRIATSRTPSRTANIVGTVGEEQPARIVLCAHYDTKVRTPGAIDNAGGVAVLLALAELLAPSRGAPGVGLEFVAFTGEEYGADGDATYVAARGATFDSVIAAVNFDGAGYRLGGDSVSLPLGSESMRAVIDARLRTQPSLVWRDPWPESNHSTFTFRGVPAVAFTSAAAIDLRHQPIDTVEWVDAGRLADVVEFVTGLVGDLAVRDVAWARPSACPNP